MRYDADIDLIQRLRIEWTRVRQIVQTADAQEALAAPLNRWRDARNKEDLHDESIGIKGEEDLHDGSIGIKGEEDLHDESIGIKGEEDLHDGSIGIKGVDVYDEMPLDQCVAVAVAFFGAFGGDDSTVHGWSDDSNDVNAIPFIVKTIPFIGLRDRIGALFRGKTSWDRDCDLLKSAIDGACGAVGGDSNASEAEVLNSLSDFQRGVLRCLFDTEVEDAEHRLIAKEIITKVEGKAKSESVDLRKAITALAKRGVLGSGGRGRGGYWLTKLGVRLAQRIMNPRKQAAEELP